MKNGVPTGFLDPADIPDSAAGPELEKAPTGIAGLDQITGGGLPLGRVTLVAGRAGAGKTLLGMQFLVAGARKYGEPGVLVSFEESPAKVALNVRSLGFNLGELARDGLLEVLSFRVEPSEVVATGEFDLEPLFVILDDAIGRTGAKRVVLDPVDSLFGAFGDDSIVRAELSRLARWLEDRGITAIMTAEPSELSLTRHGTEEYITDCVIVLDNRVEEELSTRRLRVVKYRGSAHGTNEYPFLISEHGFVMLPITSIVLDYPASEERVSTGIGRLDHMLGGGLHRGSILMVSGAAGTGKSSVGASLVDSTCARGERALLVLFEESPDQFLRNMRSIGLDLRRWVDAGLLRIWAARPSSLGQETHLGIMARVIAQDPPSAAVLDGIACLSAGALTAKELSVLARQIDMLKAQGVTTVVTALGPEADTSTVSMSSMVDSWLLMRNVETNGERNRLMFVLKSRGTAHSNQVREFILTDHGVELVDVYVGPEGVLAGSARLAQEAARREAEIEQADDLSRRRRELRRSVMASEAHLRAAQDRLDAERTELARIDVRERTQRADARADRSAMAMQRWADTAAGNGGSDEPVTPGG